MRKILFLPTVLTPFLLLGISPTKLKEPAPDCFPSKSAVIKLAILEKEYLVKSIEEHQKVHGKDSLMLHSTLEPETHRGTGSGVVLYKLELKSGLKLYRALTAFHIVKDLLDESLADKWVGFIENFEEEDTGNQIFDGVSRYTSFNVLEYSKEFDLAVIAFITDRELNVAKLHQEVLIPGTRVYTSGHPMGLPNTITEGIVSFRFEKNGDWVCTAQVIPGSSGGGVFSLEDNTLIGITVKVISNGGHRNFMGNPLPIPYLHVFVPTNIIAKWLTEKGLL